MWADNETGVDLLGFEFLVDGLVVALTEPRLLPLTIGVLGDWGSGKSSLMRIASSELSREGNGVAAEMGETSAASRYLTINFSPWQYEDHEDVKIALMNTVLDALEDRVPQEEDEVKRLRGFTQHLKRWSRRAGRAGATSTPIITPVVLQALGADMDPTTTDAIGKAIEAASKEAGGALAEPGGKPAATSEESIEDIAVFREELIKLVDSVPNTDAVIVFIDDLDRCLPETVVDTFEAIRLFLNTPKTAYVLALNQQVVESAVDARYPELRKSDGAGIGRDYLEKMLQMKIVIPPLSAPEAETYVNLLFAEMHLSGQQFDEVRQKTSELRAFNSLEVVFNAGVANEVLNSVPADFAADLEWAANIAPILGSSLRGNPRQLKRFLNNLLLKHRSASRRNVTLEMPILAKLMVLEDQYNFDFQRIFDWQLATPGPVPELREAEEFARSGAMAPTKETASTTSRRRRTQDAQAKSTTTEENISREIESDSTVTAWASKAHIKEWLKIEPSIASVDLRPYFTYSRDKLSFGVPASRLTPHLQQILAQVQSETDANRRRYFPTVADLEPSERAQFTEALLDRAVRYPKTTALTAALELAELNGDIVQITCDALRRIPPASVPAAMGTTAVRRLPESYSAVSSLLSYWESSSENPTLAKLVSQARAARRGTGSGNLGR